RKRAQKEEQIEITFKKGEPSLHPMGDQNRYTYVIRTGPGGDARSDRGPYYDIPPYAPSKIRFSPREIRDILVALVVLTAAFAMILFSSTDFLDQAQRPYITLGTAAGAVVSGFFLHEMGHKFTAQRYGCWAEFRAWPMGLLFALLTSMGGFLFAAPGAVVISGSVNVERNGKISLAGPLVNMAMAGIFLPLSYIISSPSLHFVFGSIAFLNIFLGFFNMLPMHPLDGSKVVKWNIGIYGVVMAAFVALFLITWRF
ncbi:MAG: site-2 protease family protein, partial [Thermoplasmata archaeon]|nr:site-2 protease family protein [Thermoplasmata archaeon]